ncbi:hypothetical protein CC86DRAFT_409859 [Ophiobolus disseminans]|uniref:DUF7029 domain-containing protein n=1 Tax=Ophiobolus disseminans TaxID=1469910 RepID=A0A6A6ZPS9_9PLEO|nr:hypothetical protein CC86DRAFT_409859 [Ophiobolus disseminans]
MPSGPVRNRVLRPMRDPSVDRSSAENFIPSNTLNLFYGEPASTYTTTIPATLAAGAQGILLENIDGIESVTCAASAISIIFVDEDTASLVQDWPVGTLLFTLFDGCNSVDERGVYVLEQNLALQKRGFLLKLASSVKTIQQTIEQYTQLKAQAEAPSDGGITNSAPSATLAPKSSSTRAIASATKATYPPPPECSGSSPGGRQTILGTTYDIYCGIVLPKAGTRVGTSTVVAFKDCLESCNADVRCLAAAYRESPTSGTKHSCTRYGQVSLDQRKTPVAALKYDVAVKASKNAPKTSYKPTNTMATQTSGSSTFATSSFVTSTVQSNSMTTSGSTSSTSVS